MMIWYAMLAGGMVLTATGLISPDAYTLIFVAANVWLMQVVKKQPRRMDNACFSALAWGCWKFQPMNQLKIHPRPGCKNPT